VHADEVTGALDLDAGDAGTVEGRLQHVADAHVFGDVVAVALTRLRAVSEPTRHVVGRDSQTETVGIYFLAHYFFPAFAVVFFASASSGVASTTVMWLVRLRTCNARPCARGWNRLSVVPSST